MSREIYSFLSVSKETRPPGSRQGCGQSRRRSAIILTIWTAGRRLAGIPRPKSPHGLPPGDRHEDNSPDHSLRGPGSWGRDRERRHTIVSLLQWTSRLRRRAQLGALHRLRRIRILHRGSARLAGGGRNVPLRLLRRALDDGHPLARRQGYPPHRRPQRAALRIARPAYRPRRKSEHQAATVSDDGGQLPRGAGLRRRVREASVFQRLHRAHATARGLVASHACRLARRWSHADDAGHAHLRLRHRRWTPRGHRLRPQLALCRYRPVAGA